MKLTIFLLPFLLNSIFWVKKDTPAIVWLPVEICDNGIDDDSDGLVDLNDETDCKCEVALPESLIPNPSFEERTCCPLDRSQLYCANNWIQASEPTTDYLHTCGWMGWPDLPPPLPFPDGQGCVGFRNGRVGGPAGPAGPDEGNPNWKEYAGACLLAPLKAGSAYRFEFWIGFTQAFSSPPTTIVFYGSTDCINLPFGVGNEQFGCPLNGPGWKELGEVPISGAFQWKLMEINVMPTEDIYAIAIGPNCSEENLITNTYYFFDNLVLADVKQFEFRIKATGNPCGDNFSLSLPQSDTLTYQWYKNGIALIGETGSSLEHVTDYDGKYEVRIVGPNSCRISPAYKHRKPEYQSFIDQTICPEDTYFFNNAQLNTGGNYTDTLPSYQGCDSIIHLRLQIPAEMKDTVFAKIFESETYKLGGKTYDQPGQYDAVFASQQGCDSLVHLVLDFYKVFIPNALSPNGDGINDVFTVYSGADVKEVLNLEVFDRWGGKVFSQYHLPPNDLGAGWDGTHKGKPASTGVYTWFTTLLLDSGRQEKMSGSVTLVR